MTSRRILSHTILLCCVVTGQPLWAEPAQDATTTTIKRAKAPDPIASLKGAFADRKDYQSGDLLTWGDVSEIVGKLRTAGADLPEEEEFKSLFLEDGDRLAKLMRTKKGKKFFQKLAKKPESIDRLDRYRGIPQGYDAIEQLVNDPYGKGHEFFTYLADTKLGKGTDKIIAGYPQGKDFDKPTGRIYIDTQLYEYLSDWKKSKSAEKSANP